MKPDPRPKKKILIVEDERQMLTILSEKFRREGFVILEAKDGQSGLSVALRKHPDIILLDIVMPKMDGLEMFQKLRKDKWGKTVPVVVLTNLNMDEKLLKKTVELEPSFYLVKSDWRLEDVVQKVKERLGIVK